MRIQDSTLVITGGAEGIGLATAKLAVSRGGNVVLFDVDGEALDRVDADLGSERVATIVADVRSVDGHASAVELAIQRFGGFDVWVNSAGLARHRWIVDLTEEQMDWMMDVNLKGTVLGSQAALRHLAPKRCGHIVNIVSTAGLRGIPTESFYCATKWAVRGFTQALVEEAARDRVKVTAVLPGGVATPFWEDARDHPVDTDHMLPAADVARCILSVVESDDACVTREVQIRSMNDSDFTPEA